MRAGPWAAAACVDRCLHAFGVADIALAGDAADVGGHAFGVVQVEVEHRDLGAQAGEFAGGGFAEAGASTGDECGVSLDFHG